MQTDKPLCVVEVKAVQDLRDGEAARIGRDDSLTARDAVKVLDDRALESQRLGNALSHEVDIRMSIICHPNGES
jgi:hypothetical protein